MGQFESFSAYFLRLLTIETFAQIVIWFGLLVLLRKPLSRLLKLTIAQTVWFAAALSGIIAFTIRIGDGNGTSDKFWLFDPLLWSIVSDVGANWALNALLFIPTAFLLTLFGKKPWIVFASLLALSALLETVQTITRVGVGDPSDFVANCIGTLGGVLLGLLIRTLLHKRKNGLNR